MDLVISVKLSYHTVWIPRDAERSFFMVKVGMIGVGTVSQMMHLPILSGLRDMY